MASRAPVARRAGERAGADLRALQVLQEGQRLAPLPGGRAQAVDARGVLVQRAVGEVQPGDVHPGVQQGGEHVRGVAGRPDGGDDLRFPHLPRPPRRRAHHYTQRAPDGAPGPAASHRGVAAPPGLCYSYHNFSKAGGRP